MKDLHHQRSKDNEVFFITEYFLNIPNNINISNT